MLENLRHDENFYEWLYKALLDKWFLYAAGPNKKTIYNIKMIGRTKMGGFLFVRLNPKNKVVAEITINDMSDFRSMVIMSDEEQINQLETQYAKRLLLK
jgi:hypothetical protein